VPCDVSKLPFNTVTPQGAGNLPPAIKMVKCTWAVVIKKPLSKRDGADLGPQMLGYAGSFIGVRLF